MPDGRVECQPTESYILVPGLSLLPVCFSLLFSYSISIGAAQKLRSGCVYVDIGRAVSSCRVVNRGTSVLSTYTPTSANMTRSFRMKLTSEVSHL